MLNISPVIVLDHPLQAPPGDKYRRLLHGLWQGALSVVRSVCSVLDLGAVFDGCGIAGIRPVRSGAFFWVQVDLTQTSGLAGYTICDSSVHLAGDTGAQDCSRIDPRDRIPNSRCCRLARHVRRLLRPVVVAGGHHGADLERIQVEECRLYTRSAHVDAQCATDHCSRTL